MKIERINENTIKCTLNKNDLAARDLAVSDFTYGSEKTNLLFQEMTSAVSQKFGFQANDASLSIEAIPISDESIEIIISKVDDPEELDTRFSKFTPTPDDVEEAIQESIEQNGNDINKANELLNLLSSFHDALAGIAASSKGSHGTGPGRGSRITSPNMTSSSPEAPDGLLSPEVPLFPDAITETEPPIAPPPTQEVFMTFSFLKIDDVIELSCILKDRYHGESALYQKDRQFFLLISSKDHQPQEFNQICNIICEYGHHAKYSRYSKLFLDEYCELLIENNALESLREVKSCP